VKRYLILILFVASNFAIGQDEKFYRRIFTNELINKPSEVIDHKIVVKSPVYQINLDQEKQLEGIRIEKRDGIDFIVVLSHFGEKVFQTEILGIGNKSRVLKIQLKTISIDTNTLIIHFYEGKIDSTKFESTAKLYFLTFPKNDYKKMVLFKGPHFFHEKEKVSEQYWNRRFTVNTIDYNNDGVKEISIKYKKINRVYFYISKGLWKKI
jgi:hypothetical protein